MMSSMSFCFWNSVYLHSGFILYRILQYNTKARSFLMQLNSCLTTSIQYFVPVVVVISFSLTQTVYFHITPPPTPFAAVQALVPMLAQCLVLPNIFQRPSTSSSISLKPLFPYFCPLSSQQNIILFFSFFSYYISPTKVLSGAVQPPPTDEHRQRARSAMEALEASARSPDTTSNILYPPPSALCAICTKHTQAHTLKKIHISDNRRKKQQSCTWPTLWFRARR